MLAKQLGVNPDACLMAVAIGASSAFLTPIGHQNNALILGPGGYRFGDYWLAHLRRELEQRPFEPLQTGAASVSGPFRDNRTRRNTAQRQA